jgi:UDP-N-acetylglucosamine--N-acetylmuramyl-(pentapeptide) pyrophosphoryl-undecaprenol N-acetylglucosamine transferase
MKNKKNKISICTGGTGGHIFPAQALGDYLLENNYEINVLIDKRGLKQNIHWNPKIKIFEISSLGLHKKNIFFILKMMFFFTIGMLQSLLIFLKNRPKVLVSFGGYSSIPPVLAAITLRIPIVMHEQNSVLGKAHKLFIKFTKVLAISFKDTICIPKGIKTIHTGLPIRSIFTNKQEYPLEDSSKLIILVSGGSQGANILGSNIADTFSLFKEDVQKNLKVYHQCRKELIEETEKSWQKTKVEYIIKPFFNNIYDILKQSSLIIGRSGASTIAEINALHKMAIYIPFAKAADNHQELNALNEVKYNGAKILLEKDFTPQKLFMLVQECLNNKQNKEFKNIQNQELALTKLKNIIENIISNR